ncbi:protein of unknown function [Collimonas sp. OK607]|uniref:HNH endonuclease n=1 Tax=Collimonas sp. OK607 TaxID=1798194 RepID=UPI0008E6C37F|nr:HNH endonuclease [Collimonas sp. OK607]SFB02379.1 protein of unknown function [Collimonas sp. OK607]
MSLNDIQNPASVLAAVVEFKDIGREAFLQKYGFGSAREYYLMVDGQRFDSKAILGAAHGYEFPGLGPLPADEFSGGAATVERKLRQLGFTVERGSGDADDWAGNPGQEMASKLFISGSIYTRDDLKRILSTQDATINTGVFRPAGFSSVLLFVTKDKTQDRTQYADHLDGETLHWQGQSRGRTDPIIIEHQRRGLELLVFYREQKYEHDGAGFRYEGCFKYVSHSGKEPTDFTLRRVATDLDLARAEVEVAGDFDPSNVEDARKKMMAAIVRRQGQPAFRRELLRAYSGRCAVTGCQVTEALEAAHIMPYRGPHTNHISNGLLLRADLHTLFDLGLIAVDQQSMSLIVAPALRTTDYEQWHGKAVTLPAIPSDHPNADALRLHREATGL